MDTQLNLSEYCGEHVVVRDAHFFQDGAIFSLEGHVSPMLTAVHTPGHTPGSVCYEIEGELFTGDTVFEHGWGRTDLPGGNEGQMMASLRRLIPMIQSMPFHAGH
jgi:glyoxylase-like metal-dependent hydrolase (beta-lactamase superfamily II)